MPTVTTNFYLLQENGSKILLQNDSYPQITCTPTTIDGCKIIFSSTTTTTP
jgi:hypothetical protein